MAYFIEVPLVDDQVMRVEVTEQVEREGGLAPAGRRGDEIRRLPETLSAGLGRAQAFAAEVLDRMRSLPSPPESVAVEFGLKLSAKTGVVVAESTGEGHLLVRLEWRRPGDGTSGAEAIGSVGR